MRFRIVPILLLHNSGLYKSVKFDKLKYIGDPINAVRIFNEKYADELVFLDIDATKCNRQPDLLKLRDIASECFMPLSFGGGINSVELIREILNVGVEKVILNTSVVKNPSLISDASKHFGKSTIVVSIDVRKNLFNNYTVYINGGTEKTNLNPYDWARKCQEMGAGEIIINSIDNDGMMNGYDWKLLSSMSAAVKIPVVAAGGAGKIDDFVKAIKNCKVSAVAAGSFFIFQGKHKAVLITYPDQEELSLIFDQNKSKS